FPAVAEPEPPPQRRLVSIQWMAVAAGVLFVASIGFLGAAIRSRAPLADALKAEAVAGQRAQIASDSLARVAAKQDSVIASLRGRDLAMVTLSSGAVKDAFAR